MSDHPVAPDKDRLREKMKEAWVEYFLRHWNDPVAQAERDAAMYDAVSRDMEARGGTYDRLA